MDILSVLLSVNKIALLFFILTLGFVIYEFSMYLKEGGSQSTPHVPQFNPNAQVSDTITVATPVQQINTEMPSKKNRLLPLLIALFLLIVLGVLAFLYTPSTKSGSKIAPTTAPKPSPTPLVKSLVPTSISKPTAAVFVEPIVEEEVTTPTSIPSPTQQVTITPPSKPVAAVSDTLPAAGSFQYLLLLSVGAFAIIAVSLLF